MTRLSKAHVVSRGQCHSYASVHVYPKEMGEAWGAAQPAGMRFGMTPAPFQKFSIEQKEMKVVRAAAYSMTRLSKAHVVSLGQCRSYASVYVYPKEMGEAWGAAQPAGMRFGKTPAPFLVIPCALVSMISQVMLVVTF